MTKLKRKLIGSWQKSGEVGDQSQIGLEIGRSLNQNRPQFPTSRRRSSFEEIAQRRLAILQPAEMGDHLMDLGGKPETGVVAAIQFCCDDTLAKRRKVRLSSTEFNCVA